MLSSGMTIYGQLQLLHCIPPNKIEEVSQSLQPTIHKLAVLDIYHMYILSALSCITNILHQYGAFLSCDPFSSGFECWLVANKTRKKKHTHIQRINEVKHIKRF